MAKRKLAPRNKELEKQVIQILANVRQLRREKALTAAQMAERMGISRPFYTQLEGGTRRLGVYYLLGMARALGVNPKDLL